MIYQTLLTTLRTVLTGVSGLPADRRWLNTAAGPSTGVAPFVEDGFTAIDSEFAECGPNAMRRCEATYRVSIRVPLNTDAHAALSLASTIEAAFAAMQVTIAGQPVEVLNSRAGPALTEKAWLHVPVYVSLTFDHQ